MSCWCGGVGILSFFVRDIELPCFLSKAQTQRRETLSIQGLREEGALPSLSLPPLEKELLLFEVPRHPLHAGRQLYMMCRRSQERFALPETLWQGESCRVDLRYDEWDRLCRGHAGSPFWIELLLISSDLVRISLFVQEGMHVQSMTFCVPIRNDEGSAIPTGSPLCVLAGARWLGPDLVRTHCHAGQSTHWIELQTQKKLVQEGSLWVFDDEGWHLDEEPVREERRLPCARLLAVHEHGLEWEGWDGDSYSRFQMGSHVEQVWRGRELWSQVRIRSSQQLRGLLERQEIVMHVGDWAMKKEGIWKVLRAEEKKAFISGALWGELFILDAIQWHHARFVAKGALFSASRTHAVDLVLTQEEKKRGRKS